MRSIPLLHTIALMIVWVLAFDDANLIAQSSHRSSSSRPADAKNPMPADCDQKTNAETELNHLITQLARQHLPHTYQEDKDWNKQAERWDGIQWRREGWRLETKRKKKLVNHGTWRKYSAKLVDPAEHFGIQITNLASSNGKIFFDLQVDAAVELHGRQSKWVKGVQLYSISADAQSKLTMVVSCELDIDLDLKKLPPDIILKPRVTRADIRVNDFKLDRVSKAGGEVAQQLSRAIRKKLDKKIEEKETKIVKKLNQSIAKNKDDWIISFDKTRDTQLAEKARPLLSQPIRNALDAYEKRRKK